MSPLTTPTTFITTKERYNKYDTGKYNKINEKEIQLGTAGTTASWHEQYRNTPWIYVGNLDTVLTEGDIVCVLSQWGEIDDLHLVRDNDTGVSKGFAFCKYSDPRSCILAVDNFIGIQLCGRSIRVDHVINCRLPLSIYEKEANLLAEKERTGPGHVICFQASYRLILQL